MGKRSVPFPAATKAQCWLQPARGQSPGPGFSVPGKRKTMLSTHLLNKDKKFCSESRSPSFTGIEMRIIIRLAEKKEPSTLYQGEVLKIQATCCNQLWKGVCIICHISLPLLVACPAFIYGKSSIKRGREGKSKSKDKNKQMSEDGNRQFIYMFNHN